LESKVVFLRASLKMQARSRSKYSFVGFEMRDLFQGGAQSTNPLPAYPAVVGNNFVFQATGKSGL
jgi:hypothetical protein